MRTAVVSTETQPAWAAVLDGESSSRAAEAALAVAAALRGPTPPPPEGGAAAADSELMRPTLANGHAGQALFHAYLDAWRPGAGHGDDAVAALQRAFDALADAPSPPHLYSGFSGVAWVAEHLTRLGLLDGDTDPGVEVDGLLLRHVSPSPWRHEYDLTSGLVGYGVYALARLPRVDAAELLARVVARLEERAQRGSDGATWHTAVERMRDDDERRAFPNGNENLGVAHGVPGVIAVLAQACGAGIAVERARPLLEEAVDWLLAQQLDDAGGSLFPYAVAAEAPRRYSRAAWCYGDPGIAATLLIAARCLGRVDWERRAFAIARHAARRPEETSGVREISLCHGSAGLAHIFNRLYQASGETLFRETAQAWIERTLAQRRPGQGYAGFVGFGPVADGELAWNSDPSFLTGAAGVGLALLAAIAPQAPQWDEVLLLSPVTVTRAGAR